MAKQISRDPFARETLFRETIFVNYDSCNWCGQVKTTRTGKKFLYKYFVKPDSLYNRKNYVPGGYCSIDCMRVYND